MQAGEGRAGQKLIQVNHLHRNFLRPRLFFSVPLVMEGDAARGRWKHGGCSCVLLGLKTRGKQGGRRSGHDGGEGMEDGVKMA